MLEEREWKFNFGGGLFWSEGPWLFNFWEVDTDGGKYSFILDIVMSSFGSGVRETS